MQIGEYNPDLIPATAKPTSKEEVFNKVLDLLLSNLETNDIKECLNYIKETINTRLVSKREEAEKKLEGIKIEIEIFNQ